MHLSKLARYILGKLASSNNQPHRNGSSPGTSGLCSIRGSSTARSHGLQSRLSAYHETPTVHIDRPLTTDSNCPCHRDRSWSWSKHHEWVRPASLNSIDIERMSLDLVKSKSFHEAVTSTTSRRSFDIAALMGLSNATVPVVFSSLCVCDDKLVGLPVYTHSKHFTYGPRSLRVGRAVFANFSRTEREESGHCAISIWGSTQPGLYEPSRFFLDYHDTLFSITSDGSHAETFVLVSTMSITAIIRSQIIRYLSSETFHGSQYWKPTVDALPEARRSPHHIDWMMAALQELEETNRCRRPWLGRRRYCAPAREHLSILGEYAGFKVQRVSQNFRILHRDCILLLMSPTTGLWKIRFASYNLACDRRRLVAGFSAADPAAHQKLLAQLKIPQPFSILIKWEIDGTHKTMYCQPMYRKVFHSWICFMVNAGLPDLWAGSEWSST